MAYSRLRRSGYHHDLTARVMRFSCFARQRTSIRGSSTALRALHVSSMVIDNAMREKLSKLLPLPKGRHGKDDRLFLEAVCWVIRTGAPWRDLPPNHGNWKSVYNHYNRWVKQAHFNKIFDISKKRWRSRMTYD